jgi:SWI/SNF-related matrix-associated actin-dependent regulator of chromatin subfamily D
MSVPHPQQIPNPQYMAAAAAAAQRNMPQVNEAALRRSRKPTDKTIPDGVEDVIVGEGVQQYKTLRDLEKRLDASMVRKRLDIQDSISRTVKRYQTLRIWISNTVEDQPWQKAGEQNGTGNAANPGSGRYKVRIEGRLLDDDSDPTIPEEDSDEEEDNAAQMDSEAMEEDGQEAERPKKSRASKRPRQRFSHFFKSITIDFDKTPTVKPEDMVPITWNKPQLPSNATSLPPNADFDSLQFSRPAQENVNITVSLVRDETPERYKVSKELAEVLDVEEESRSGIVHGIWDYIKAMGLQEDEEKRQIRCDHRLKAVCGTPLLSRVYQMLITYTDLRTGGDILPADPGRHQPPHDSSRSDQVTLHDPCRRGLPQGPLPNHLRHPCSGR